MKKIKEKITAFSLAELAVVLMIIAVVASITIKITTSKMDYVTKFMYYSTYNNLKTAVAELIGEGCDINIPLSCDEVKALPLVGHSADNSTGFCDRLTNIMNTIGTPPVCDSTTTKIDNARTDFTTATPNFTTTNGAIYYNFGTDPTNDIYTVYVDIDGVRGKSLLDGPNPDVMKFTISRDGIVLPDVNSPGANNTKYLSTSIRYKDNNVIKYLKRGVTFKESECTAGVITDGTYCGAFLRNSIACPDTAANTCEVVINKPGF